MFLVERTVVASKATFVKTWCQVVVHIVLSNFSSFFRCLPTCLRKINKLSIGITAMTDTVFSDRSSEAFFTELCWRCLQVEQNEDSSLSSSGRRRRTCSCVGLCQEKPLAPPLLSVLVITPRPHALFCTKSPLYHLANGASQAGRGRYRRCDQVRLGPTENPSKSQLSHFFENDNKWIRLQHHVFSPLEQMLPGTRNETSFLGLFSDLAHGIWLYFHCASHAVCTHIPFKKLAIALAIGFSSESLLKYERLKQKKTCPSAWLVF